MNKFRLARYYLATLAWVNYRRLTHGRLPRLKLPPNDTEPSLFRAATCPIARALGNGAHVTVRSYEHLNDFGELPASAVRMVRYFDSGSLDQRPSVKEKI
jgi:hypothetical protein